MRAHPCHRSSACCRQPLSSWCAHRMNHAHARPKHAAHHSVLCCARAWYGVSSCCWLVTWTRCRPSTYVKWSTYSHDCSGLTLRYFQRRATQRPCAGSRIAIVSATHGRLVDTCFHQVLSQIEARLTRRMLRLSQVVETGARSRASAPKRARACSLHCHMPAGICC